MHTSVNIPAMRKQNWVLFCRVEATFIWFSSASISPVVGSWISPPSSVLFGGADKEEEASSDKELSHGEELLSKMWLSLSRLLFSENPNEILVSSWTGSPLVMIFLWNGIPAAHPLPFILSHIKMKLQIQNTPPKRHTNKMRPDR